MTERYSRQIALFGQFGQDQITKARVVQLGVGGLGMHVVQQLAYLGVLHWTLADNDIVSTSNLNRLIGARPDDVDRPKVHVASRLVQAIQTDADVTAVAENLPADVITAALVNADLVIGAFDQELPRLTAIDQCSQAGVPYVDVATEVISTRNNVVFGGRVVVAHDGHGCPDCLDLIDHHELAREQMAPALRQVHDDQYGIRHTDTGSSGPSVVTLNGVVASLAATEIMCLITGLRPPHRQLTYRGDLGTVCRDRTPGRMGCPFCKRWRNA